ncbi:MAG: hypothetical protein PQJ58_13230 [Spirochaetales bacterium]|nr:hypothetical protein [Spirochaetales bacterium]
MKRVLLSLLLISLIIPAFAEEKKVEDKEIREINVSTENLEGRAKIGVAIGYPSGLVFGYRLANYLEANLLAGSFYNGFTLGGNLMFTVADIKIKEQSFPLSLGPQVNFHFGKDFNMSLMGFIRWEYTFEEIPLNLYLEGGPGLYFLQGPELTWSTSLGVRYVF